MKFHAPENRYFTLHDEDELGNGINCRWSFSVDYEFSNSGQNDNGGQENADDDKSFLKLKWTRGCVEKDEEMKTNKTSPDLSDNRRDVHDNVEDQNLV